MPRRRASEIAGIFLPERRWGNYWDYFYVREKLASDPLYPGVLDALRGSRAPLLDVGCGLGLLAHALHRDGQALPYRGVDIDQAKIARARRAAQRAGLARAEFAAADLAREIPPHAGSVAVLDVLQYLSAPAQRRLLDAAIAMLTPGARLVIRAALDDEGRRGRYTRWGDRFAHLTGWMPASPKHYPRAQALRDIFDQAGLSASFAPLHGRTPFNHWLIVAARS
ncbi:class I SAM-dependent methyltransferase [Luteimonas aquatica]|uniref:class I SAM-dependent methyltransferase n=1 Tax=Luteimonas aquatica TaxID=450364 RepID=UPI001F55EBAE|nr:class I SAM-dependent methyltransferase [Luteimonas aquatica]